MEQFIFAIETYTDAAGTTPQRLLRAVLNAEWGRWDSWKAKTAYPTARTMDRVYRFMRENPAGVAA